MHVHVNRYTHIYSILPHISQQLQILGTQLRIRRGIEKYFWKTKIHTTKSSFKCNYIASSHVILDTRTDMEKEMATHSSVLAWRIPWTEKPGRLQSMGSHRVGHDWSDLAAAGYTLESKRKIKLKATRKARNWKIMCLCERVMETWKQKQPFRVGTRGFKRSWKLHCITTQ